MKCPVCGEYEFEKIGDYDICHVCFWENDGVQFNDPNFKGGANKLSLNQYKEKWNKVNSLLPNILKICNITHGKGLVDGGKYHNLQIPREHINHFIDEMTKNDIAISLNFYNTCENYDLNKMDFYGFPKQNAKKKYLFSRRKKINIEKHNNEMKEIIFSENPIETCQKYNLKQNVEILTASVDVKKTWKLMTPLIDINFQICG